MIPKIIHYCWLSGDPYPELITHCIESWKKVLPDYKIMLWDTTRIDLSTNLWLGQAYENKKYAFAADYIRFYALYHFGGIYLDSDVEVLKSFDDLLGRAYFLGEEYGGDIEAAVIGAEPGLPWVKECLEYYSDRPFIKKDGSFDMRPVPLLVSEVASKYGLDVFGFDYFSPKDYHSGKIHRSSNTYCIHNFDGKWVKKNGKYYVKKLIHAVLTLFLGRDRKNKIVKRLR